MSMAAAANLTGTVESATASRGLVRSTWLIAALTMVSRVLGLVREIAFSYYFSTSELLSAFRIAFMIPNLARRLFGEGALSAATIPILTQTLETSGEEASRRFVGALVVALAAVLLAATALAEVIIALWAAVQPDPALSFAAIMMPFMAMVCLTAILGGVLNVRGHFAIPAVGPVLLNAAIILAGVVGSSVLGLDDAPLMRLICYGVLIGGIVQLVLTIAALQTARFAPILRWAWRDAQLQRVMGLMAPMVLGLSAVQINTLSDYVIAYIFVTQDGERIGPAVLGYAQFLYQLPLGVFGISIATVIFPLLSQKAAQDDRRGVAAITTEGFRLSLFIALPASIGLMFVARPLVATLYERGDFGADDTARVAWALIYYSIGIAGYFSQHIFIRVFYAMHDSRTPARIALGMVAANLCLNLVLVFIMEERGLALSTSLCACVQVVWLASRLRRRLPELHCLDLTRGCVRSVIATALMAGALALTHAAIGSAPRGSDTLELVILLVVGVGTFGLAAWALRMPELSLLFRRNSP